jgi:type IV secretory pathway TrbD component
MTKFQRIVAVLSLVGVVCALVGFLMHIELLLGFGIGVGAVGAFAAVLAKRRRAAAG